MRKLVLAAATAIALASPASAQLDNPFNQALQTYQVDQQLNGMLNQAQRNYQNSVNRGLSMINPPMPAAACTPWNRSQGWC